MTDNPALIAYTAFAFILAGFVKGVIGMGLPNVAIAVLSQVMPPAQAATLMLVPAIVTNIWQGFLAPHLRALLLRLWPMFAGIVAGALLTGDAINADPAQARLGLGVALIVFALFGLVRLDLRVPPRWEMWLAPVIGLATGIATAATGVYAIPCVPYLQALGLTRHELVQSLGLTFFVCTLSLSAVLLIGRALHVENAIGSALALLPAVLGMLIGARFRARISANAFRYAFLIAMLVLGAQLVWRGMM